MGGVGEIGSNMTVFETENEYLIIDYGILFPYEDFFDINYLIVNTSQLKSSKKITLFITHGHEDHIGAVPHFLSQYNNVTLYAPAFAANLIRKKLERRKISQNITIYEEDDIINFDQYELHPVHVTHSIPDTYGLILKDKDNEFSTLFISDFKFDLNPLYEKPFNYQKIVTLFNCAKKRLCFLDSTNILVNDKTTSESELVDDLTTLLSREKRSFVTLFSSNIFRLRTILQIAKDLGKSIVPVGRSVSSYLDAAHETGIINLNNEPIKTLEEVNDYNSNNIIGVLTGCQGDFLGAIRRVSSGDHKEFKFGKNDQVIFSSKAIPGNSKKIARIYNDITATGAEVITASDYKIHASGHPGKKDLKELLEHIKPTDYFPIHGEVYFLKKHYEFIQENFNFTPHELGNFDEIHLDDHFDFKVVSNPQKDDKTQPIIIHGNDLELERTKVSERRKIACNGAIFVSIDKKKKSYILESKGLPDFITKYDDAFDKIFKDYFFNELKNKDAITTSESARIKVRQTFNNILGYKPITVVHVL